MPTPPTLGAPLPATIVGAKRDVYKALHEMDPGDEPGDVTFTRARLAEAAGISEVYTASILRWLRTHGYIDYHPGSPGHLSRANLGTTPRRTP